MPYRKRIFVYPNGKMEEKYFTCRLGGKKTREKNSRKTPEDVAKVNAKRAERNLMELILTNFQRDDTYLTLTYAEEPTYEEAKKNITKFVRSLRGFYKKLGKELKYIYTTEEGRGRVHHHILLNQGASREDIQRFWRHSSIRFFQFLSYDGKEDDAKRLASYFIKESSTSVRDGKQKVRYVASRNLKKPEVHYQTIHSKKWRENPIPPKGMECYEVINTFTTAGYPLQLARYRKRGRQNE